MLKKSKERKVFEIINMTILSLLAVLSIYPFIYQLALSLSSTSAIMQGRVNLLPVEINFETYSSIIETAKFWRNYSNSVMYTTIGTIIGLSMTTTCAYALSKKDLIGKSFIMKMISLTMFIGGGLIPYFYLIKQLGMLNTIWALILPGAILPYHVIIMRTFFMSLPKELEDAATVDGVGQLGYFLRFVLPLSKPILATMALFIAVIYWNDWFPALIYIDDPDKHPVTLYLRNIMMGATMSAQTGSKVDSQGARSIPESVQAASLMLVTLPFLLIYPFVQKYFVKGIMIGSIKG